MTNKEKFLILILLGAITILLSTQCSSCELVEPMTGSGSGIGQTIIINPLH